MKQGRAKQFYLPDDVIGYIAAEAARSNRSASNYLTMLIRRLRDAESRRMVERDE